MGDGAARADGSAPGGITDLQYKLIQLASPLRIDILVEDRIIVECKSTEKHNEIFEAQALTYLRLSGKHLALVINFGMHTVKDGLHRIINGYLPQQPRP